MPSPLGTPLLWAPCSTTWLEFYLGAGQCFTHVLLRQQHGVTMGRNCFGWEHFPNITSWVGTAPLCVPGRWALPTLLQDFLPSGSGLLHLVLLRCVLLGSPVLVLPLPAILNYKAFPACFLRPLREHHWGCSYAFPVHFVTYNVELLWVRWNLRHFLTSVPRNLYSAWITATPETSFTIPLNSPNHSNFHCVSPGILRLVVRHS